MSTESEVVDPSMAEAAAPPRTEDERWADNVRHMVEAVIGMPPNQAAKVVAISYALLPMSAREKIANFIGVPPESQMGAVLELLKSTREFINKNDVGAATEGGSWLEHCVEVLEAKTKSPQDTSKPSPMGQMSKDLKQLAQAAQEYLEVLSEAEVELKQTSGVVRRGRLREAHTKLNALVGAALSRTG